MITDSAKIPELARVRWGSLISKMPSPDLIAPTARETLIWNMERQRRQGKVWIGLRSN